MADTPIYAVGNAVRSRDGGRHVGDGFRRARAGGGRWVTRWVAEREPYHSTLIARLRDRRATGRPTQVKTTDAD
jgi:hypothetical protein